MTESGHQTFRDRLLDQDPPIPPQKYQEYRMHLENAFSLAVRRERQTRWITVGLWIATLLSMAIAAAIGNALNSAPPEWYGMIHAVLVIVTLVETISYFVRFRPAVSRARDEHQSAVLREIERQIAELARRIDGGQPPAAQ